MKDIIHLPKMGTVVFKIEGSRYEMPYLDWLKYLDWRAKAQETIDSL